MGPRSYTADGIMKILCNGRSLAYDIIKGLNAELESKGCRACRGRVRRKYFEECYDRFDT